MEIFNPKHYKTMKNLFKTMMLVAVAAMGFTACSNEAVEEVNPAVESKTYTMTFVADAPNTRTSVTIEDNVAKYSWSKDDKVGFYYVATDADYMKKGNSTATAIADNGSAAFTASFTPAEDEDGKEITTNYNIGAFYPGNSWVSHSDTNPFNNVKVKIANEQKLTAGTFDPTADLMMAKPFMDVALENGSKKLEFTRIAAVGKMNLKLEGMENGEVIKEVVFTLAEGTHFNGPVMLDLENSTYTLAEEDTTNAVTLSGELAAADRTAIFFTCFPGEYTGAYTISVTTDKATYSKEGNLTKALSFTAGNVLNFNATVTGRDEIEVKEDVCYKKITSASELTEGQYLIVCESANVAFDGALTTLDANNNNVAVTISNNQIAVTEDLEKKEFTLTKNGNSWHILAASGKYIGSTTTRDNNELKTSNTGINNTITVTDGDATITNGYNYLRYNAASGTCRFRYYKSSTYTQQKAISLYKKTTGEGGGETPEQPVEKLDQTLSFDKATATATVGENFTEPTLTGYQTTVTYASSNTAVATVNETTGEVTLVAAGETTITATAAEDETYYAGTASYTLTVSAAPGGDEPDAGEVVTVTKDFSKETSVSGDTTFSVDSNITIDLKKAGGTSNPVYNSADGGHVRLYQNNSTGSGSTMTVTAKNGKTISKIEITYASNMNYFKVNTGSLSADKGTWTGDASSVTFTVSGTSKSQRAYIKTVKVTYN